MCEIVICRVKNLPNQLTGSCVSVYAVLSSNQRQDDKLKPKIQELSAKASIVPPK